MESLVREALEEPGIAGTTDQLLRGRLGWCNVMLLALLLALAVLAFFCGVRFLQAEQVPEMLRWGAGLLLGFLAIQSGKTWYWMQHERIAMTREIRRVKRLVALLAHELRARG
jgi:hypothetical protein